MSEVRFAQRRRLGTWQRFRLLAYALLGLILAGGLVWLVWFSTVLGVRQVKVEGAETLVVSSVRTTAAVVRGEPLAQVDTIEIQTRVAELERVESVEVKRSWPNTITIKLVERSAVAWIRSSGAIRGLDRYGVDFRTYKKAPKSLFEIRVTAFESRKKQDALVEASRVIGIIKADDRPLFDAIRHVNVGSKDSVELMLTKGRAVSWGSAAKSSQKLAVLRPLLAIKARSYDVSAPEQPTTKN